VGRRDGEVVKGEERRKSARSEFRGDRGGADAADYCKEGRSISNIQRISYPLQSTTLRFKIRNDT
jgi:hypothetical protein